MRVLVCGGTGCVTSGSQEVKDVLETELEKENIQDYKVIFTGCQGFCEQGPLIRVEQDETFYCNVDAEGAKKIVHHHLKNGQLVSELLYENHDGHKVQKREEIDFYQKQERVVINRSGFIDPENIDEYLNSGGYQALQLGLTMEPEDIITEIQAANLRGRGGGGFPTGLKWEYAKKGDEKTEKYVVCNADEGDPGAFMDRSILEGDPHVVIEGMAIAGLAIGANRGIIYVRAEYPLAVKRLEKAISQAKEYGYLGERVLGSNFSFDIEIKQGAGAFVCGEETALIESVHGNRGMPRPRPPFPAEKGLYDSPTILNNVETLANIPVILNWGAQKYNELGTKDSKGTKVFAITGKVRNTGLCEVPMGIKLKDLIFDIGGGIKDDKEFKAVQIGGPSGGCLPQESLDFPIEYDSLIDAGAMMGSGGLVVMDTSTCMVDLSRFFLNFTQSESCGKCNPCREGTKRLLEILNRIIDGYGENEDLKILNRLGNNIINTSLCGLGQSAPNPVLSTIRYFENEYLEHINNKYCRAGVCKNLTTIEVDPEKCSGCEICKQICPVDAIKGEKSEVHNIDSKVCIKCKECIDKCPLEAIE
ncbi:NADH-quinone oxidoreductase subunit NuoF [Natranaerobius thermophilus]|uniref:NADH dehydrogenase (Quinone) n=1 Tax=Natranaerobius thermophilus (strain ATCC BAA-1301 / DSM 18059 / JW/NM-WN-LF) TaxID=457570 RepID=B2A7A1_NATTJ|nr:NADH-quinone oxidoreductase subunit NuoF [Natranaerobius thermophilus]ACB84295.1 NADH dehydrogenase (quinone) [Natranaerobius thermophilus JW/NM-WN-LF]